LERLSVNGLNVMDSIVSLANHASVLAQATTPSTGPAGSPWGQIFGGWTFPLMMLVVLLWVFMFRSKRRDDQKKKELLSTIKRGDRVQTIGGILGKVVEVEEQKILLKVDESSNTKIWFSRNAIFRVVGEEKAEAAK
jgi:preprotein translocase subunit YajC